MNQNEADKQIQQMIAFIAQEAREKAEEISVRTEKEFMAEKLTLESQLSQQIRQEHEKEKKDFLVQKQIEKSKLLSGSHFEKMRRRDDKINELKRETLSQLAEASKSPKYPELLKFLIAQGLQTLLEKDVVLSVKKEELSLAKQVLPEAIKLFQDNMERETKVRPSANISFDEKNFLPSSLAGGVVLSARNGQILCKNTLDHRLDIAFEALKPAIRGALFGVREKIVNNVVTKKGPVSLPK